MDLSLIRLEEHADMGATLELIHPVTREALLQADGSPVTITLLGIDSAIYRKKNREAQLKRFGILSRGKKIDDLPTDEERAALVAACTTAWSGIVVGAPLQLSEENALMLYTKYKWIRDQADEFMGDRRNFFPA